MPAQGTPTPRSVEGSQHSKTCGHRGQLVPELSPSQPQNVPNAQDSRVVAAGKLGTGCAHGLLARWHLLSGTGEVAVCLFI